MMNFTVASVPHRDLAMTNKLYANPQDFNLASRPSQFYIQIKEWVFTVGESKDCVAGTLAFSAIQRTFMKLGRGDTIAIKPFRVEDHRDIYLSTLELEVNFLKPSNSTHTFDCQRLEETIKKHFELQIFCLEQRFIVDVEGFVLTLRVVNYQSVDLQSLKEGKIVEGHSPRGLLTKKTQLSFVKAPNTTFRLKGASRGGNNQIFRPDWNFENMGIGGLDAEFSEIFRRAFASRVFPQSVVSQLGINHVKGMLLYGPPGTGKTLLARQIGKMLNGKEPKIVNGPEILNKFVGQSEENIRALFIDAEKEFAERGDDSDLHIIIFDEIDAICKSRGSVSSGTGVHDTVVNQLLTKIDGVDSLNNILIIGMTNRKDMIDEALLRPGRLEVHVEIGLPDETGRLQIYRIHTSKMAKANRLEEDVDLAELASISKNYTGAEIEGVVRAACSYAFNRSIDAHDPTRPQDPDKIKINAEDFALALDEVRPKFGVTEDNFSNCCANGIIPYGAAFERLMQTGNLFIQQVKNSERTPLVSVLVDGPTGAGKTAVAATLALNGEFPFVKLVSPDKVVGYGEAAKCQYINAAFEDAYKSQVSCLVLDDIERLLDYVPIGPRFSNTVLQSLLVLLKKSPPKGRRLLIIGTTSNRQTLASMGLVDAFNATISVPCVSAGKEIVTVLESLDVFPTQDLELISNSCIFPIPIKKLLMIAEMAQHGGSKEGLGTRFVQCMKDYGVDNSYQ